MLGLYVHVPFCAQKCNYCDFNSYKIEEKNQKKDYLISIKKEMELYKEEFKNKEFTSVDVYKRQGYKGLIYLKDYSIVGNNLMYEYIYKAKSYISNTIRYLYKTNSDFINSMMLGQKDDLSQNEKLMFTRTGTSHIIAISGLHTGCLLYTSSIKNEVLNTAFRYSNLEYDIDKGERGSRYSHLTETIKRITNAEDVLVVNNNAAAVLLVLSTLAKSKEAIVSRGELVEVGGSFRIPSIMELSGAKLVEVGATNKDVYKRQR